MKRTRIKAISKKRRKAMLEYADLIDKLRKGCDNCSEISGERSDWRSNYNVEPHHIMGRIGKNLLDPFNIIIITREEHIHFENHKSFANKEFLLGFVQEIRLKQGFKEE